MYTTDVTARLRTRILLIPALLAAGALAACGGADDPGAADPGGTAEANAPAEPAGDVPVEFRNALTQAETLANTLKLSKKGVYDHLTNEFGGQFPAEAAQYAVDNVKVDWKENALESAKVLQNAMSMSRDQIYDQLTSESGHQFTPEEAQYAIDNLSQ